MKKGTRVFFIGMNKDGLPCLIKAKIERTPIMEHSRIVLVRYTNENGSIVADRNTSDLYFTLADGQTAIRKYAANRIADMLKVLNEYA